MMRFLELEGTPAPKALGLLNQTAQEFLTLPACQAALAEGRPKSWADYLLSQTEEIIVEGLASSILKCERNAARIGELISDTDPEVLARLVQRVKLWRRALPVIPGTLLWPKYAPEILAYVLWELPSKEQLAPLGLWSAKKGR
jgi:hypothetical protein